MLSLHAISRRSAAISSAVRFGARPLDRHVGEQTGRACGEEEQPVGKADRLLDVVRHQQGGNRPAIDQLGQFLAQPRRQGIVERHERLVEQEEVGLDRERARKRHAPRQSERKLARIVIAMRIEPERAEQRLQVGVRRLRRGQPHVLFDACATAAAAAPGTPCRACRGRAAATLPS